MGTLTIKNLTEDRVMEIYMNAVDGADVELPSYSNDVLAIPSVTNATILSAATLMHWMDVRRARCSLLSGADIAVAKAQDNSDVVGEALARTYRQSLRDITLQPDPLNITWPTPPV